MSRPQTKTPPTHLGWALPGAMAIGALGLACLLSACGGTTTFAEPPATEEPDPANNPQVNNNAPPGVPDDKPQVDPNLGFSCETGTTEPFPGFPFDVGQFHTQVQTRLDQLGCSAGGCHGPGSAQGGLQLHPNAQPYSQQLYENICSVKSKVLWEDVASSLLLTEPLDVAAGGTVHAPVLFPTTSDANYQGILSVLEQARDFLDSYNTGGAGTGGGTTRPPDTTVSDTRPLPAVTTLPFDFATFQTQIQPLFDDPNYACSAGVCHGQQTNAKLYLSANPAPGSDAMKRNFFSVADPRFYDFRSLDQSLLLSKPTGVNHAGGAQFEEGSAPYQTIRAWLAAARAASPETQVEGNDDPRIFDYPRFQAEIMPQLNGGTTYNCANAVCHGKLNGQEPAGAGRLFLWNNAAPGSPQMLENYASVAAFLNLENPTLSTFLTRPRGIDHTGGVQFPDERDTLYLTVLDWILAARGFTHLDQVYFTLRVQDIFSNPAALGEGNLTNTCASLQCHGTNNTGLPPGNRSDFALLAFPNEPAQYAYNFTSASNFVNRIDPLQSSLLLYPLSVADGGVPHPGGDNWLLEGETEIYYRYTRRFVEGLKPVEGYMREWLVVGPIDAAPGNNELPYLEDEVDLMLTYGGVIPGGAGDVIGEAIIMDEVNTISLDGYFGGETDNKVAYAMAYVFFSGDVTLDVEVVADDKAKIWAGPADASMEVIIPEATATPSTTPVSFRGGLNRILVKVLNAEAAWSFSMRLLRNGQPYNDVIIKLSPDGANANLVGGGGGPDAPQYDYEVLRNDVFTNQVIPAFNSVGCGQGPVNGVACHEVGTGGFTYRNNLSPEEKFNSIARNPRVRLGLDNYETSRVLAAPISADHQDRQNVWNGTGDARYQTVLGWIRAGAEAQE